MSIAGPSNHRLGRSLACGWMYLVPLFCLSPACASHPHFGNRRTSFGPQSEQEEAFQRGLLALKENRLEDSLEALTAAERERPTDARVRNFRGIVLARLGKNRDAAAEYGEAIRLDPQFEDAYRNLGFLEWTERHLERARDALSHAVDLSPGDSFAHYYLGRTELDAKAYSEAFHELEIARVNWPSDPDFLMEAAAGYEVLGKEPEAQRLLDKLVAMPLNIQQSVQAAKLLVAARDAGKAVALLRNLNSSDKDKTWASFDLALAYLFAGSFQEAVDQAYSCVKTRQGIEASSLPLAPVWSLIGIADARLGLGQQALDAFRKASALAPHREEHWLNLTRELMEQGLYAEAVSGAQDALRSLPNSYALHLRLGAAYLAAGHYPEAEATFRELVTAGDPLATSYVGLAQVLLRTGHAEEAVTELTAAQQKLGTSFLISYFRGLALDRAAKPKEALLAFQEAVEINPRSAEAHLGVGKTELQLDQLHEAVVELETVLRLDPRNAQARHLLSQAYRRLGDSQHARKYAVTSPTQPAALEGDLLGDFLPPEWQFRAENE
jgi:tetratricopeptide (TPR) repeat protein